MDASARAAWYRRNRVRRAASQRLVARGVSGVGTSRPVVAPASGVGCRARPAAARPVDVGEAARDAVTRTLRVDGVSSTAPHDQRRRRASLTRG